MIRANKLSVAFKTVSALVAGIFLWNQIAWGGGLIDYLLDKQREEQEQMFSPDYLQQQQAIHEEIVDLKQFIEDNSGLQTVEEEEKEKRDKEKDLVEEDPLPLQGPSGGGEPVMMMAEGGGAPESTTLSITTEAGDVIHYLDNVIDEIENTDGTVFRNILLDADNNLVDADVEYADGTLQLVRGGVVTEITKPDGAVLTYNTDELIESVLYPDGTSVGYSYVTDGAGAIIETILTDSEKTARYTSDNKLYKVEFNTGRIIEHENGIISKIIAADTAEFIFETTPSGDDTIAELTTYKDNQGNVFTDVDWSQNESILIDYDISFTTATYGSDANIKEVVNRAGDVVTYTEGLIDTVSVDSETTYYQYHISELNNVEHIEIDRMGIKRVYDKYGNLQSLTLDNATKIVYENGEVSYIEKPDGTQVKDITFSESGELYGGLISYPDGSMAYYNDGELLNIIGKEGEDIDYTDGKIRTVTLSDGSVYDWSYDGNYILIYDHARDEYRLYLEGQLLEVKELSGAQLTTAYYYDLDNNLIESTISKDDDILYTYTYTYEDGLTLVHDEDGNIQAYTPEKKLSYIIDSKDRKYTYTYGSETDGLTEIVMPDGSRVKYGSADTPIEVLRPEGTLITDIVYDENNEVTDFTYIADGHTYEIVNGEIATITDPDGTVTEYGPTSWVQTVTAPDSTVSEYDYEVLEAASLPPDGTQDSVEIINQAGADIMQLSATIDPAISLLLNLNGSTGDTTTTDESSFGHVAEFSGDAHLDTSMKKFGTSSLALDGDGDYISLPDSEAWNFGGDDFTIDYWVRFNAVGDQTTSFAQYAGSSGYFEFKTTSGGSVEFHANGSQTVEFASSGQQFDPYVWYHMALVRSGDTFTVYKDGTAIATKVKSTVIDDFYSVFGIGAANVGFSSPGEFFNGWLDGIRITKGLARWTSDFTPPGDEVTAECFETPGTFTSDPIPIDITELNSISWNEILPTDTSLSFEVRTGDTLTPDDGTWGAWTNPLTESSGSTLDFTAGQYVQYRVNMATNNNAVTPQLIMYNNEAAALSYVAETGAPGELESVVGVKITVDGNTTAYTKDEIDVESLLFDAAYAELLRSDMSQYVLDEAQKQAYLDSGIILAELSEITSIEGDVTQYAQGRILDIAEVDGTAIQNISYNDSGEINNFNVLKDGDTYEVREGTVYKLTKADGTVNEYSDNGWLSKVTLPGGETIDYAYGTSTEELLPSTGVGEDAELVPFEDDQALQLGAGPDPYLSLLLNLNGEDQATETTDSSTHGHNVVFEGNAQIDTDSAKFGTSSLKLDGNGSYITLPNNDAWYFAGQDFTIDFWVKLADIGQQVALVTQYTSWSSFLEWKINSGGAVELAVTGSSNVSMASSGGQFAPNLWYHLALVRNGNVFTLYKNGTQIAQKTVSTTLDDLEGILAIGAGNVGIATPAEFLNGWFDEIRISKGVARWTEEFTPPSEEHQSDAFATSGTFTSSPAELNANNVTSISWDENLPAGTAVTLQVRTGNTTDPNDGTWSDWSTPATDSAGSDLTVTPGDYIQYRVNLSTTDVSVTPQVIMTDTEGVKITFVTDAEEPETDDSLAYVRVTENGVTKTYDENGVNVEDPNDTIDIASLTADRDYAETEKEEIISHTLNSSQKVLTIYDKNNDVPIKTINADHSITHYDEGYPTIVTDKEGTLLVQYTYDADKKVLATEFVEARIRLEEGYQSALADIATQRDAAIAQLDQAEIDARNNIEEEVTKIQGQIDAERLRLQAEKSKYDPAVYDLSEFDRVFRELDDYETNLYVQEAEAYADLDQQVADARQEIENDAQAAMNDLLMNDYNVALGDIVQKESSPVIYSYYRNVLGRDPDQDELEYWLNKAKTDLLATDPTEITQYLQNLQEYIDRETWKDNIIVNVISFLNQYLAATQAEKEAMLSPLGLTFDDVSGLTLAQEDIDAIEVWLEGQSLHFGDSAFKTIIDLLAKEGTNKTFEEIGRDCIKVDILTGVITKDTTGDLLISMYAMTKIAEVNGLTLHAERIDFDELKSQLTLNDSIILHVNRNHYVVLVDINETDGTVTYKDLSVGESGQDITLSRAEFMEEWQGYVLSKNEIQNTTDEDNKYLNEAQEKNIRGAGWWNDFWKGVCTFFQAVVAPIATILMVIPGLQILGAALHGLNMIIQTISFAVGTGSLFDVALAGIQAFTAGIIGSHVFALHTGVAAAQALANSISTTLKGVFAPILSIFKPITTIVSGIATGIGNIFTPLLGEAIATTLATTVIGSAVNIGTSFLFDTLEIDPSLSYFGSALLSGLSMGMATGDPVNIIAGALRAGTIAGMEIMGEAADLDPNVVHLAAMTAGSLTGGFITTQDGIERSYEDIIESIQQNIISECAYVSVTEVGELLGIDERISYLAGIGIRSSLSMGFSSGGNPLDLFLNAMQGVATGVTNIGLQWAGQALGLSPLLASLSSAAIAGGLEALLEGRNPVEGIFDTYFKTGKGLLTLGGPGATSWEQAAYIAQVLDFSQVIMEQGIAEAIETYATGFLHQATINEIWKQGGIAQMLLTPSQVEITTNVKGETVKRIYTSEINTESDKETSNYLDLSLDEDKLMGYRQGNVTTHCDFVIGPDGRPQLINGEQEVISTDGSKRIEYVNNFKLTKIDYYDDTGTYIGYYAPADGMETIVIGDGGQVESGRFLYFEQDYSVNTKSGEVTDLNLERSYIFNKEQRANLLDTGLTEDDLLNFKEIVSMVKGVVEYALLPPTETAFDFGTDAAKTWMESLEAEGKTFWQGIADLIYEHTVGDPLPSKQSYENDTLANINLNTKWPVSSTDKVEAVLDTMQFILGDYAMFSDEANSLLTSGSRWRYNTDYAANIRADLFTQGHKFVYGGGVNSDGLTEIELVQFYNALNTIKSVGIGFSASSVETAKSWVVPDAVQPEHNLLMSPQLTPAMLTYYMNKGGVTADKVTVVEIAGDFKPFRFENNLNPDGTKKWNYIKILNGSEMGSNPFKNHGIAVSGLLNGGLYTVEVNGVQLDTLVTLEEVYSSLLEE